MSKLKIKAMFIGMNGQSGYLNGEEYHLELSRDTQTGMLRVEREQGKNDHDVSSETPFMMETDEEFFTHFDPDEEVDFSDLKEEKKVSAPAKKTVKKK